MEGGSFSKRGSRLSAAHTRPNPIQGLHGWRAGRFQNVALASAPRAIVPNMCKSFVDGGRLLFKMWISPYHRAHLSRVYNSFKDSQG
eukprot:6716-Pyramimonas_sp.AAC.1